MLGPLDLRSSIERSQPFAYPARLVYGAKRLEDRHSLVQQSSRFDGIALRHFCARNQGLCEVVSSVNGLENPVRVGDVLHSEHG